MAACEGRHRRPPRLRPEIARLGRYLARRRGGDQWEDDLVFTVAGKMFCVLCVRGPRAGQLGFKVEDGRFLELTGRPGFAPAPYLARAHWVLLAEPRRVAGRGAARVAEAQLRLVRARLPNKTPRALAD